MPYLPDRGHVVWSSLDPTLGHEQGRRRPVLVLTPKLYNRRSGLMLACSIISHAKGYPFEVPIPEGLAVSGVVLADHLRSLDWNARQVELITALPDAVVEEVLGRARSLLA